MEPEDRLAAARASRDAEWPARHEALDKALTKAIRAPVVDARFDREVWERIRADASATVATDARPTGLGMPLWLAALNVIAIAAAAAAVAFALGAAGPAAVAKSVAQALALGGHTVSSSRPLALVVTSAMLWLCLRQTPFLRAVARAWL
jgi:hypothetical protein